MTNEISRSKLELLLIKIKKVRFILRNFTKKLLYKYRLYKFMRHACEFDYNFYSKLVFQHTTLLGNSDDPGDVLFNILQRVLEQDENTDLKNFYRQQILK